MSYREVNIPIRYDPATWLKDHALSQQRSHDFAHHIELLGAESIRWRADRHLLDMSSVPLGTPRANGETVDLPAGAEPHGPKAWPLLQIDTLQLFGMDESLPTSPAGMLVLYTTGMSRQALRRDYILKFYPHDLDVHGRPTGLIRHSTPAFATNNEWSTWLGQPVSLRPQGSLSYPGPLGLEQINDGRYGPSAAFFAGMQTEYESWRFQWCFSDNPFKGMHVCISAGIQMFGHPVYWPIPRSSDGEGGDSEWIVLLQVSSMRWSVGSNNTMDLTKIDNGCCDLVCLIPKKDWERGNLERLVMTHVPDSW